MWLPALAVIPIDLNVANGCQETRASSVAQSEQGNLVVKIDKTLDDHFSLPAPSAFLCVFPSGGNIRLLAQCALAFSRATHDRLHHTGHPDRGHGSPVFLLGGSKTVGRSR